jgi:hypothetical protein
MEAQYKGYGLLLITFMWRIEMVKVKDFLGILCSELEYRFFSGVPFIEAKPIYDNMTSDLMHYVPAANEHIAVSMVSGVWVSGFKACVLLSIENILKVDWSFNENYKIPVLVLSCFQEKGLAPFPSVLIGPETEYGHDIKSAIGYLDDIMKNTSLPAMLFFKEGTFK